MERELLRHSVIRNIYYICTNGRNHLDKQWRRNIYYRLNKFKIYSSFQIQIHSSCHIKAKELQISFSFSNKRQSIVSVFTFNLSWRGRMTKERESIENCCGKWEKVWCTFSQAVLLFRLMFSVFFLWCQNLRSRIRNVFSSMNGL